MRTLPQETQKSKIFTYIHTQMYIRIFAHTHTHVHVYTVCINFILEINQMQLPCISKRQELQDTQERHEILATSN